MQQLSFQIQPSSQSNDHQVRVLINGKDILGKKYLGIDPPDFYLQKTFFSNGKLMIGRCTCGVEGCGDYQVDVSVDDRMVRWSDDQGLSLEFDKQAYISIIKNARNDHSWEDDNRKIERLVSAIFAGTKTRNNFTFQWCSARINIHAITLSFVNKSEQKIMTFPRDKKSLDNTLKNAKLFKEKQLFG